MDSVTLFKRFPIALLLVFAVLPLGCATYQPLQSRWSDEAG